MHTEETAKTLWLALNTAIGRVVDSGPRREQAFSSDGEYLQHLEALFLLKFHIADCSRHLSTELTTIAAHIRGFDNAVNHSAQVGSVIKALNGVRVQLEQLLHTRLSQHTSTPKPRLVRLSERLQLSERESQAFHYIVLCNIGISFPPPSSTYHDRESLRNMAFFAGMDSRQVLEFLGPDRTHIKENIFQVDDDPMLYDFSGQTFKMSKEVLSVLVGASITPEEFLTIDKTVLAELLLEEGFDPQQAQAAALSPSPEPSVDELLDDVDKLMSEAAVANSEEEDKDLFQLLKEDAASHQAETNEPGAAAEEDGGQGLGAYADDLEYLKEHFEVISLRMQMFAAEVEQDPFMGVRNEKKSAVVVERELKAKERRAHRKCQVRTQKTLDTGGSFVPRMERLVTIRHLSEFEKWIVLSLVGFVLSPEILKVQNKRNGGLGSLTGQSRSLSVGALLSIHFRDLKDQIAHRRFFYKNATLVRETIIKVSESRSGNKDLTSCLVEIDRRMIDFVVSLETEFGALVEGSTLYTPQVHLDQVVLPPSIKQHIVDNVSGIDRFRKAQQAFGFDDVLSYGRGVIVLFHGMSGTGKTMMANAVAHHLGKRVLLASYSSVSANGDPVENARLILREAKIENAIVFFDECEALFESRDLRMNYSVNVLLTALERHDDLILLATNRPMDLDSAMYRRLTLAVEFPLPSLHFRKQIWQQHIPDGLHVDPDVDFGALSRDFCLTGGFIKNAVLGALKLALMRVDALHDVCLSQEDLVRSCKSQLMGQLQLQGGLDATSSGGGKGSRGDKSGGCVVPSRGMDDLVVSHSLRRDLTDVITSQKANRVLSAEWGFQDKSLSVMLVGPSGVGKSLMAEAVAYETGRPLIVLSCAEILSSAKSQQSRQRVCNIFSEWSSGCVVVVQGCEILFSRRAPYEDQFEFFLFQLQRCKSVVFLLVNSGTSSLSRDASSRSPLQHVFGGISLNSMHTSLLHHVDRLLEVPFPDRSVRQDLWQHLVPSALCTAALQATGVFRRLAQRHVAFCGRDIERALRRAASLSVVDGGQLSAAHLEQGAHWEQKRLDGMRQQLGLTASFSMYR